ncbi:hypothetical protein SFRURICE_021417 [Spodoptera frugiperda]|nr:hypothetical protein SFRURICE_021417 [Spodoptera frugiperda]
MINDTTEELDKNINNDSIDFFTPVTEVYDTDDASTGVEPLFLALAEEGSPVGVKDTEGDSKRQEEYSTTLAPHDVPDMMVDIVIPSLLIAALFVGNALIVLIIYKYRKRKEGDDVEDEFNTIPLSVNGNVHSAGNAV